MVIHILDPFIDAVAPVTVIHIGAGVFRTMNLRGE